MSEGEKPNKIEVLMNEIHETLGLLETNLPRQVDGYALSQKSKLPWKVLLYREALIWRIVELGRSALESILDDRLVSGVVLTRAAVETSAALWYLSRKVDAVVDSKMVGDVDEYLMKLAMGTATGWPEADSSGDVLTLPRPIKIGAFLKQVEKDIEGFSHQYGILSEYAHPNWAGTVLLYSSTDRQKAITDFGTNMRKAENAKAVGVVNLSVALKMFHAKYDHISDVIPAFISVCEAQSSNQQNSPRGRAETQNDLR
jgi:hypothetical protein